MHHAPDVGEDYLDAANEVAQRSTKRKVMMGTSALTGAGGAARQRGVAAHPRRRIDRGR